MPLSKKIAALPIIILVLLATACATTQPDAPSTTKTPSPPNPTFPQNTQSPSSPQPTSSTSQILPSIIHSYTNFRLDGNRIIPGKGGFPAVNAVDISLDGLPQWVLGGPLQNGSVWVTVLETGQVQAFHVVGTEVSEIAISPPELAPGQPPLLRIDQDAPSIVTFPSFEPSLLTHPVPLTLSGNYALLTASGDLVITAPNANQVAKLAINALPDARILVDEHDRLLVLTNPTTIYDHGVLGDRLEAASITLIETIPTPGVLRSIDLPEGQVIEGIAPIWVDINDDGAREIIITVSNTSDGSQIVVYSEDGAPISAGLALGQAFRWRHQIAAGDFGPHGEFELVDVLTPHIGGSVEFYRPQNNALTVLAQVEGYTSHVLGTRNLDMAVAGDFDGDGQVEALLPNQARTELAAIRRNSEGAHVTWTLPVGGQVVTNLATANLPGGVIAVGVGRQDHFLRIWVP